MTGLLNRWRKAEGRDKLVYLLLGLMGLGFWLGLFAGLTYGVSEFYQVEVFGPLITRKLLELLLMGILKPSINWQ